MGYLIDTNILSELRKPKRAEQVAAWFQQVKPSDLFTSVLVLAELRRGSLLVRRRDPASADKLDGWIADLRAAFGERALVVSPAVADRWADLMGSGSELGARWLAGTIAFRAQVDQWDQIFVMKLEN